MPAHLGFLAIFNPSLGHTDETLDDQIVYYASVTTQHGSQKRRRTRGKPTAGISQEERNERLRQIGLAQGMASFSRGFADGAPVDTIETDKSRVILHELEPGWWILASIDLSRVPLPPRLPTKTGEAHDERYEYSTREMKPSNLLLSDLLRAHSLFLMHHDSSLSALFVRSKRSKFMSLLSRYWDLYLSTWNVMLHGNPARELLGGINIAASGELGIGVGEEERGSGEREVLEGFVGRIEGLVDLVVSRFGEPEPDADSKEVDRGAEQPWLGTGQEPAAEDGAIFLGAGALSRKSLRDITHWMEDLYTWGEHAYGVIESPTSTRRGWAKPSNRSGEQATQAKVSAKIPAQSAMTGLHDDKPATAGDQSEAENSGATNTKLGEDEEAGGLDKMVSYLKMGYGTYWTLPGAASGSKPTDTPPVHTESEDARQKQGVNGARPKLPGRTVSESAGHYLIGLMGEIEEASSDHEGSAGSGDSDAGSNSRTVLRTVNVELETEAEARSEATIVKDFEHPASVLTQSQVMGNMVPGYNSHNLNKAKKLRVVVYVNRPFMVAFLFQLRTDSLAWDTLYRSLHYQFAPLRKSLLGSTKYRPERPDAGPAGSSIHDLVWDPQSLTVHSTIPNIPELYEPPDSWSRADAISTHLHLLNIYASTRARSSDLERTQKTGRGWWIVWTRLLERKDEDGPGSNLSTIHESASDTGASSATGRDDMSEAEQPLVGKEIFLIRHASDHARFRSESGGNDGGVGKLAQGIGVNTRRYVEELLTLL